MTAGVATRMTLADAVERLVIDREAQRLGRTVSDPVALARVAAAVRGTRR